MERIEIDEVEIVEDGPVWLMVVSVAIILIGLGALVVGFDLSGAREFLGWN